MKPTQHIGLFTGLLLFTLFFQQCKPEQSQEPVSTNPLVELSQLTGANSKIWKVSSVTVNGVAQALDDCQKSTEITFLKENTGALDFYATSCGKKPNTFSWEIIPDTLVILLATQEKQKLIIQELNQTRFKYITSAGEGLNYEFTLTAK